MPGAQARSSADSHVTWVTKFPPPVLGHLVHNVAGLLRVLPAHPTQPIGEGLVGSGQ